MLLNIKSNPFYHFVDVDDTIEIRSEMEKWCTENFGRKHSHSWDVDVYTVRSEENHRTTSFGSIIKQNVKRIHRFSFANIDHRDWFILRWT